MFFHVVLTTECNLQCRYCFGESLEDFDEDFASFPEHRQAQVLTSSAEGARSGPGCTSTIESWSNCDS